MAEWMAETGAHEDTPLCDTHKEELINAAIRENQLFSGSVRSCMERACYRLKPQP